MNSSSYQHIWLFLFVLFAVISFFAQDGYTPIMCAAEQGHLELAKLLVQTNADLNMQNKVSAIWHGAFGLRNSEVLLVCTVIYHAHRVGRRRSFLQQQLRLFTLR